MEKWLDAFSQWPAGNQLIFSCLFLVACLVVLMLFGIWTGQMFRYAAIVCKGWPQDETKSYSRPAVRRSEPVFTGYDWQAEQRRIAEEAEEQKRLAEAQTNAWAQHEHRNGEADKP